MPALGLRHFDGLNLAPEPALNSKLPEGPPECAFKCRIKCGIKCGIKSCTAVTKHRRHAGTSRPRPSSWTASEFALERIMS